MRAARAHPRGPNDEDVPREASMEADRMVENQVRRVPPSLLVGLALGSMALSAAFAVAGKLKVANFIGQWVPSLLILATFDRLMQAESGSGIQAGRARCRTAWSARRRVPASARASAERRAPSVPRACSPRNARKSLGREPRGGRSRACRERWGAGPGRAEPSVTRCPGNEVSGTSDARGRAGGNEVFGTSRAARP